MRREPEGVPGFKTDQSAELPELPRPQGSTEEDTARWPRWQHRLCSAGSRHVDRGEALCGTLRVGVNEPASSFPVSAKKFLLCVSHPSGGRMEFYRQCSNRQELLSGTRLKVSEQPRSSSLRSFPSLYPYM